MDIEQFRNNDFIFWPVLCQVVLTIAVFVALNVVKARALKAGEVDLQRRALHTDAWPDSVLKVSNNINNQFETPVLFYVLCFILWALEAVNAYTLSLAWAYALSRIVHAWIHTHSNVVPLRKRVFTLGVLLLLALALFAAGALLIETMLV